MPFRISVRCDKSLILIFHYLSLILDKTIGYLGDSLANAQLAVFGHSDFCSDQGCRSCPFLKFSAPAPAPGKFQLLLLLLLLLPPLLFLLVLVLLLIKILSNLRVR